MEHQRFRQAGDSVVGVEILGFVRGDSPQEIHLAVVELNEILRAGDQTGADSCVVRGHDVVAVFGGKSTGADHEFGRAHEAGGAGHEIGIFSGDPEGHESAHRETGGGPVVAVGDGAVGRVDVRD